MNLHLKILPRLTLVVFEVFWFLHMFVDKWSMSLCCYWIMILTFHLVNAMCFVCAIYLHTWLECIETWTPCMHDKCCIRCNVLCMRGCKDYFQDAIVDSISKLSIKFVHGLIVVSSCTVGVPSSYACNIWKLLFMCSLKPSCIQTYKTTISSIRMLYAKCHNVNKFSL